MKFQNSNKDYIELERITHEIYWSVIGLRYSLTDKESQHILKRLCLEYLNTVDNLPDNDQTK